MERSDLSFAKAGFSASFTYLAIICAVFSGVVFFTLYPMLWHLFMPLVDIPNHIARFSVMANPNGPLSAYYEVQSNLLTPNSAVDLLWQATGMQGDPVVFSRATMMFYAINLILSVVLLSRVATGRWSIWPAVAGLLVYNGNFFWGFQNYVFTVPFSIHALTLWLLMERYPTARRVAVFIPISIALYLMHLLAFGVLATAVLGREIQRFFEEGPSKQKALIRLLASGIPFLLPTIWYVYQSLTTPVGELGNRTEYGGLAQRLRAGLSIQWENPLSGSPEIFWTAMASLLLFSICFSSIARTVGPRLQLAAPLKGPIIALAILSLLAPSWLNGVALIHIRFPFVAVALLVAGTSWVGLNFRNGMLLTALFASLLAVRSHQFEEQFANQNADIQDLMTVLSELPPGSRLLPLRAPGYAGMRRLWHVQAYGTTYNDVFVPTFFQGSHSVKLKEKWSDYAAASYRPVTVHTAFFPEQSKPVRANPYWIDWETKFTHVLFLDKMPQLDFVRDDLRTIKSTGRFSLLKIQKSLVD